MKLPFFWYILAGVLLPLLFQYCKNQPDTTQNTSLKGHNRMIAILDSIYRNADPRTCYNLNSRAAEMILQQMQAAPPQNLPSLQFNYAFQLLRAGETEAATVQFSQLVQATGDQLNEQTKILYEMLALCYLRLGEQQNCINTHTPESCVIPISGEGIYKMTAGPENAIKVYERILKAFPDDVQSRWLLNLACMALGKWPDAVPKEQLMPAGIFKSKGDIRFREIAITLGVDVRGTAGGVCIEDFDGDNNLDLFLTKWGLNEPTRFFHNNGDGTFSERTAEANLTGLVSGLNAIHADYDNDGDRDVFILRGAWLVGGTPPNSLLPNNGDGTFTDVTIDAGLLSFHPTQTADWADFDGDGWLDLFIGNETYNLQNPHPCELYHNNGNGTFTNLAPRLGVDFIAFIKAVTWGDVNNDQRPDIYLSNLMGQNILLINRGGATPETWKFEEMTNAGVGNPENSFPAFFFDYNNDGLDDIFTTSFIPNQDDPSAAPLINEMLGNQPEGDWLRLYRNNGDETFTDVHRALGLHTITYAMGNNFCDLDNDGWLDIFLGTGKPDLRSLVPNRVFHNLQGKRFEDISMNGFSHIQKGHGVAIGDLDNDGDQDVYVVVGGALEGDVSNNLLYENPGNRNHWVTLFLEGVTCNRDAIGAKIKVTTVETGGTRRHIWVTVGTGGSFGSSSLRQEIGLGQAQKIESIEVQWPKVGVPNTVYTDVSMDKALKLKEGNSTPEVVHLQKILFGKGAQ
ncbi:MAG TPA: FG-GAP-like repeat-containing protein [Saprospiraceae bacterium]|nr:FG-GAP-like repeat-containing protein [Saprospiraceae bacterium]